MFFFVFILRVLKLFLSLSASVAAVPVFVFVSLLAECVLAVGAWPSPQWCPLRRPHSWGRASASRCRRGLRPPPSLPEVVVI